MIAVAVAAACVIAFGAGMGQAHAEEAASYSAASAGQIAEQASASASCALLRKDGNLWRCTSTGQPVSKYWSGNKQLAPQLNKVKTIFVASDVTSVTSNNYAWVRYRYSTGRTSDYRYSASFSSSYLKNVKTVKFLTSSGASKCKVIADGAFGYAPSIANVVNFNKTKVTRIGERAFSRTRIASLAVPKTLKTIDKYAFYNCSKLTSVSGLNKSKLSTLGIDAFASSKKLKSIALPKTCKVIGDYAFYECAGLKSATLGSQTSKIGNSAFSNCEKLSSITLPVTCKKIGYSTFSGCSSLKKAVMRSTAVVTNFNGVSYSMSMQFYGTPLEVAGNDAYIYVPSSVLPQYQDDGYTNIWYNYRSKFKAI